MLLLFTVTYGGVKQRAPSVTAKRLITSQYIHYEHHRLTSFPYMSPYFISGITILAGFQEVTNKIKG